MNLSQHMQNLEGHYCQRYLGPSKYPTMGRLLLGGFSADFDIFMSLHDINLRIFRDSKGPQGLY